MEHGYFESRVQHKHTIVAEADRVPVPWQEETLLDSNSTGAVVEKGSHAHPDILKCKVCALCHQMP